MTIDELVELLNKVVDFNFRGNTDGNITYTLDAISGPFDTIIKAEDVEAMRACDDSLETTPVRINALEYNEILLRDDAGMPYRMREMRKHVYEDNDNHVIYEVSQPSLRMYMAILKYASSVNTELIKEIKARTSRIPVSRTEENPLWFLNTIIPPRYTTLIIRPQDGFTLERVDPLTLCTSFTFSYAYNLGKVVYPTDNLEDAYDLTTSRRLRRGRSDMMEPPKKKYIPELVNFYLRGASGESRDYQYLSYYHILEYFFEKVYMDNVVQQLRSELTHPSFSYKRDKDIKGFFGKVKKIVRETSVQSGINELESLKLTLKKYVPNLLSIKDGINNVSAEAINYLRSNTGAFSKHTVNFDLAEEDVIYSNLAGRIYATRNAIAHSKEGDSREKFIPYKHDNDLLNEVLLIRIVAEEVIINSSKEL